MGDELKQMLLSYLNDMADRGDYEAKKLFELMAEDENESCDIEMEKMLSEVFDKVFDQGAACS